MTPQGWQCPLCKTVYAPHVDQCACASGERTFDVHADNTDEPNRINQAGDPFKVLRELTERLERAAPVCIPYVYPNDCDSQTITSKSAKWSWVKTSPTTSGWIGNYQD